jgi:hypothetical protein
MGPFAAPDRLVISSNIPQQRSFCVGEDFLNERVPEA